MPPLGMVAVPEDRDRLAERRPDVVEVDPRGHHAHDHLECAGLGQLDLLELEGVLGLALALLTDHPRRHRLRELTRLQVELRDLRYVYSHASPLEVWGSDENRGASYRRGDLVPPAREPISPLYSGWQAFQVADILLALIAAGALSGLGLAIVLEARWPYRASPLSGGAHSCSRSLPCITRHTSRQWGTGAARRSASSQPCCQAAPSPAVGCGQDWRECLTEARRQLSVGRRDYLRRSDGSLREATAP